MKKEVRGQLLRCGESGECFFLDCWLIAGHEYAYDFLNRLPFTHF